MVIDVGRSIDFGSKNQKESHMIVCGYELSECLSVFTDNGCDAVWFTHSVALYWYMYAQINSAL